MSYQQAKARALANPLAPNDPRHGTVNGYSNCFCRCERCRAVWRRYIQRKGWNREHMRRYREDMRQQRTSHD